MSTLKVDGIRSNSATSDAITLASDGTCTAKITNNLSNRNVVINGESQVSQRFGTSSTNISSASPQFVVDRFIVQTNVGGGTNTHQQVADAPAGLYYSQKVTSANGGGNPGSAFARYRTIVEWEDVIPQSGFGTSNAKPLILSFYVKSSLTGTFGVAIQSYTNTRNIVNSYTINSANTWERKTVVITADTNNSWASTGAHMEIGWDLGEGPGRSKSTLNSWGAGISGYGYNSGVKFFTQAGATWQITGVQLEVDHTASGKATDFEHLSFAETLRKCQRYYWKIGTGKYRRISGYKRGDGNCHWEIQCPVPMRTAPSPTLLASGTFTDFQSNFGTTQSGPSIQEWNTITGHGLLQVSSNWNQTHKFIPSWEGYSIEFSAEL
jgi:hypothetical protein